MAHLGVVAGSGGWHVEALLSAAERLGHRATRLDFRTLSATVPPTQPEWDALLVRTMPAGSLEQIVFRMDWLHTLFSLGVRVVNSPRALECGISKYLTSARLALAGIPTPRTVVAQTVDEAMNAWDTFAGEVVVKPVFGSEGRGLMRIADRELFWRVVRTLVQTQSLLYLQEFIHHPGWDVRLLLIGDQPPIAMKRTSPGDWRTNVAQGATPSAYDPCDEVTRLARAASAAVGTTVAGVDLISTPEGGWTVLEVNAVPGWRALATTTIVDIPACMIRHALGEQ